MARREFALEKASGTKVQQKPEWILVESVPAFLKERALERGRRMPAGKAGERDSIRLKVFEGGWEV